MKITLSYDDGTTKEMDAECFYLLTVNYKPVQNENTKDVFHVPDYFHHIHGDLRELSKELKQKLEEGYANT